MVAADAKHARDLGGFEPAPEMQVQDRVLPFVERGRGFPDEVGGGGAFREGERVGRCARVFDGGEIEPVLAPGAACHLMAGGAHAGDGGAVGDGEQPALEAGAVFEGANRLERLDERVLGRVLRLGAVPQRPREEVAKGVEMPFIERGEGAPVAVTRKLGEGRIGEGAGGWLDGQRIPRISART